MRVWRRYSLGGVVCALCLTVFSQHALAQSLGELQQRFMNAAQQRGPQGLLGALDQSLRERPNLAADPGSAANVASAAAAAAGTLSGARSPVYRAIIIHIEAAAPAQSRSAVGIAIANAVTAQAALATPPARPTQGQDIAQPLAAVEGRLPPSSVRSQSGSARSGASSLGIEMGSFVLYPDILVAGYWDDNIFATNIVEEEDWVTVIAPSLDLRSQWERHEFRMKLDADLARYGENESENSDDYRVSAEGRFDISGQSNFYAGGLYSRDHEERSSPDAVVGFEPTIYTDSRAYAGIAHGIGKIGLRFGGSIKRLNFDDTPSFLGTIDNDDRDRDESTLGARVSYEYRPDLTVYAQGLADLRNYDDSVDAFGFDRDSKGYRAGGGFEYKLPGRLSAEGFIGYMRQSYDDPSFNSPGTLAFSGSVAWAVNEKTNVYAWVDRSLEETTLFASPAYRFTGAGVSVDHYLRGDLVVSARASWENSDFYASPRSDDDYDMGVSLKYFINRQYFIATDYRFQHRDSSITVVDYDRNQMFVRFGAQF